MHSHKRKIFCTVVFLCFIIPVFTYAADPPTLTAYTISNNTIYPSATTESGLATTTSIDIAFSEQVKASIRIISAGGALVKSLYSTSSVTNPTPKIWDGTNSAGMQVENGIYTVLILATSTASGGLTMSDSSKTITIASQSQNSSDNSNNSLNSSLSTPAISSLNNESPEYIPVPTLKIITKSDRIVSLGADTIFSASVYDNRGNKRDDAVISWSFGDGMQKTGASVFHTYYEPGEYMTIARAITPDGGDGLAEVIVTVKSAGIKIVSVSSRGIELKNDDTRALDLSFWRLLSGGLEFKIPENTWILAKHSILFPSQIIELPTSDSALLLYPSGEIASAFSLISDTNNATEKLSVSNFGNKIVQVVRSNEITARQVETITNVKNVQTDEETVIAPAEASVLATAGAALPNEATETEENSSTSIFRSPWTLGLLGTIIAAGAAFILI